MLEQSLSDKAREIHEGYLNCEQYILAIPRFSKDKHSLHDLRRFLKRLDDPHQGRKIIHVAGTNGKGSVCAYLHAIFTASGISTGLFTSPHLETMRERIKVNGRIAGEAEFVAAFAAVKEKTDDFHPTFFEFIFLIAMVIFAQEKVECLILETGLGGRLDATNAIEEKNLAVITPVGYDHMELLGTTLAEIAGEKAGIMRPGVPLVTACQSAEVACVLQRKADEYDSPFAAINNRAIKINEITLKTIDFSYQYRYDIIVRAKMPAKARYQVENAALAIHSALAFQDERISAVTVAAGLAGAVWPGRMEELGPGIIFDGAHNEEGILAFMEGAEGIPCRGKKYLLFAGVREKQSRRILDILSEKKIFAEIIACPLQNRRSLTAAELLTFKLDATFAGVESGLAYLIKEKKADDLLFLTGSLYLYSEAKRLL